MASSSRLRLAASALGAWALVAIARPAVADPPVAAADPARVSGLERPERLEGDGQRTLASGLLFVPREMVRLMFLASGITAGLIRDEQVVPRVGELISPSPGNISVIPSLFLDTRRRTSVGAMMLASGNESGTRLSVGFGGVHDLLLESRFRFGFSRKLPLVIQVEGLADSRSTLDYLGVGQDPTRDRRNVFRRDATTRTAEYFEQRVRGIVSAGARLAPDWELFLSASMLRSRVEDTPGGGPESLSQVFAPGTVKGAPTRAKPCPAASPAPCPAESRVVYGEMALRLDTRPSTARPSAGVLIEGYAGIAHGTGDDRSVFYRMGGRAALFVPVLRSTNVFSPKIIVDAMYVPPGAPEPPFTALVSQPDFRGLDNRVDRLSLVASFDYRFSVMRYLGARLFVDFAVVSPDIGAAVDAEKRVAGGFGLDVFSREAELLQFMMSFSGEGARAFLTFGIPTLFGDRQHRH